MNLCKRDNHEGSMLETLDHTIRIGSTPTFIYIYIYIQLLLYKIYSSVYIQLLLNAVIENHVACMHAGLMF